MASICKNRFLFVLGFVCAVALLAVLVAGIAGFSFLVYEHSRWNDSCVSESIARGDKIVAALERYRASTGSYPDELHSLVPQFLESIEPPTAGVRQWRYVSMSGGEDFSLKFATSRGYPICSYQRSGSSWYVDE